MDHHIQEFEATYGSIDAHLLKNVLALNMLHTTTAPHLIKIRTRLETERVLTNDSSKWLNATAQLDSVLARFKALESSDPDPTVRELMVKAPVSFSKCRTLMQRNSDSKSDRKQHLSTAFLAGQLQATSLVTGYFAASDLKPCAECGDRHVPLDKNVPCTPTLVHKRLMEHGDSVLSIIRQHVTDCDKIQADPQATDDRKKRAAGLKEGLNSVIKTLLSSDSRGRPGARGGGAGRGCSGSRGLSKGRGGDSKPDCRDWLRGSCDRGSSCRFEHDPAKEGKLAAPGPRATQCARPGCNKHRASKADGQLYRCCSEECHKQLVATKPPTSSFVSVVVDPAPTTSQPAAAEPSHAAADPSFMQQAQAQAALLINNDNYVALPPRGVGNAFVLVCQHSALQSSDDVVDDDADDEEDESPLTEEEQRFRKACPAVCRDQFIRAELDFDNCDFRSIYSIPLFHQLHDIGMPPQYWDSIVLTYDAYLAEEAGERALADMFRAADSQGDSFALTSSTTVAPEHVEQRLNATD